MANAEKSTHPDNNTRVKPDQQEYIAVNTESKTAHNLNDLIEIARDGQQFYGKVRATLGDKQYGYVAELEESEDRLLKAFKDTLTDADTSPAARQEVQRLLPQVQECHAVMRDRKHAMKH